MIFLNLNNVEEIIFKDKKLRIKLQEYKYLFDSYDLAMFSPSLKSLGMRCLNEFIKKCNKKDLEILKEYFNDDVEIVRLNLDPVLIFESEVDNLELILSSDYNCSDICIYRKENQIRGMLWK